MFLEKGISSNTPIVSVKKPGMINKIAAIIRQNPFKISFRGSWLLRTVLAAE